MKNIISSIRRKWNRRKIRKHVEYSSEKKAEIRRKIENLEQSLDLLKKQKVIFEQYINNTLEEIQEKLDNETESTISEGDK